MSRTAIIERIEGMQMRQDVPDFKAGDTLGVHVRIREGEKERVQIFEGMCIARHNDGLRSSVTVRKISYGVGVERVFALHSPRLQKIEVKVRGRVRRSKLYYLRGRSGKAARIRALRDVRH
jgi:large subunit ribosomal protein L19